jgi:hypothetical protein
MNSETNFRSGKIKKLCFQFFPISVFFYLTLTTYLPRNCYKFIKAQTLETKIDSIIKKSETLTQIKLRKKLLNDLKIHGISINWNKKNVTKIILNDEGKILGYKFYNIFYPNYFTKTQSNKILSKTKILKPTQKYFLVIIKYN